MHHTGPPYSIRLASRTILEDVLAGRASPAHFLRQRRAFHEYFVTHLPSSSLAPDRQQRPDQHHKLPRDQSQPHSGSSSRSAASLHHANRETTIVRIPIKNAKHHFGAGVSRGSRPYNEDTYQAGTIEMPAFAKKQPMNLSRRPGSKDSNADTGEAGNQQGAKSESGDPQVFYFGVFDGHGGSECSEFLKERLHGYIEESASLFNMHSTLQSASSGKEGSEAEEQDPDEIQKNLVSSWKETVGGYFKRFRPEYFPALAQKDSGEEVVANDSIETVLSYAFLKADLDFTTAQASKHSSAEAQPPSDKNQQNTDHDPVLSDKPINEHDLLHNPDRPASQNLRARHSSTSRPSSSPDLSAPIGGSTRFKGGSTGSIVLISTPTPTPFWHPASPSTLVAAHVGDTRILLCRTSDGKAVPLTSNHHPSTPVESRRLRRYATSFVTDSFGEERMQGLANTRAFGDISSKRLGVSAEPQITRVDIPAAGHAFLVLVSDGISGHLEDQEIVDVVKEARTPAQAATDLVNFATETSESGDNATGLVVRLGGWERRSEGGGGSIGTKEQRQYRRDEAMDPRRSRT